MVHESGVLKIKIKRVHFVGLGGIGMSGIAEVLLTQGFAVSGSDMRDSAVLRRLRAKGALTAIGHAAENLGDADVLVYSSAIPTENPEVQAAQERGIPIIPRAEMLAELMRMKDGVAIAGSHGKTTTTSLLAWICSEAGLDPTCVVGGRLESFDSNARPGAGRLMVAEADESDGSFLKLTPIMTVITNIDPEHLDYYKTEEALIDAFVAFANRVPFYGLNVMCCDHPTVRAILPRVTRRAVTYGESADADFRATDIRFDGLQSRFKVWRSGIELGTACVTLPGHHNVLNALAAIACATELDLPFNIIADALAGFRGIDRRFQVKGQAAGVTVVDDYGHHPAEIRATLSAARLCHADRVVAVFQPHRYTRTRDLFGEFVSAFEETDVLLVTDIYPASEAPIPGITAEAMFKAIKRHARHPEVHYVSELEDCAQWIFDNRRSNDLFITLGAGDVKKVGIRVLELLAPITGKESGQ